MFGESPCLNTTPDKNIIILLILQINDKIINNWKKKINKTISSKNEFIK